jgi:hypothetical protein
LSIFWWLITAARYGGNVRSKVIAETFTTVFRRRGLELQDSRIPRTPIYLSFAILISLLRLIPFKEKFAASIWEKAKNTCKVIKWRFPLKSYKELEVVPFYDTTIPIPKHFDEHLSYYFGEDWRVPKFGDNWVETRDSPTVLTGMTDYNLPEGRV